ncbi:acyltransferase [Pseudofrancisella aestuarii]|uniref:Acyltransferase n=1 Tax=Pseudofrancisella aestuarii TaxID=2670347 RepID=A0ABV9T969_9GAMM|nr:acyltransferase [Pseudofrancisella aestuarii]
MNKHWSQIKEAGGLIGLKFTLWSYIILGRQVTYFIMYFVMIYYFLIFSNARNASFDYIRHLKPNISKLNLWLYSFRHFLSFGRMLIDKFAVWNKKITSEDLVFTNSSKENLEQAINRKKGGIIFTAHLGNLEVARALSKYNSNIKINALVFSKNAQKLNELLTKVNPEFKIGMISLQQPMPDLAIQLHDKIEAGEFIVIAGDRTSVTKHERNLEVNFLGDSAPFPEGAFVLAGLLKCPCYFMICPRTNKNKFDFIFENFALEGISFERKDRKNQLIKYAQEYADRLSHFCNIYPLEWFNFFDFWNKERKSV